MAVGVNGLVTDRPDLALKELKAGSNWTLSKLAIANTYLREFSEVVKP
jgi:uncharacterized protein (DUF2237 family)